MGVAPTDSTVLIQGKLKNQLADRRARLQTAISEAGETGDLLRLLAEVDRALSRLDGRVYDECAICRGRIEEAELLANPMAVYCLCRMSAEQQRALERDLDLAWRVQAALLPAQDLAVPGWKTHFRYLPHGAVSGDYCDLIAADGGPEAGLYFMLGDVSGKGVAASLLMAHLNASLRALAQDGLSPLEMIGRANGILERSTLASHYATLVCGRANASGEVEIVNAGHCPPVLVRSSGSVEALTPGGLPLGLGMAAGAAARYPVERIALRPGDALALYTDGITEAANPNGDEYGADRLMAALRRARGSACELVAECLADLASFLEGRERGDDLTMLALARQ